MYIKTENVTANLQKKNKLVSTRALLTRVCIILFFGALT